jgi:hypothetical protein
MKDLGELKWFLGVRVVRDRPNRKLWLCQDSYIELSEFLTNPSQLHLGAGTKSLAIEYSANSDTFLCASDAAFGDNIDRNCKSREGVIRWTG